ncbi:MAG: hypothetical protein FH751_14210 [Firmicutes bacterium]|nr:hypothetical protein [Bacillota bacterium]
MASEVIEIKDVRYEETIKNQSDIVDLRRDVDKRQNDTDPSTIISIAGQLTQYFPILSNILSAIGTQVALEKSAIRADLEEEEDLYTYIYEVMTQHNYDLVKLEQKYELIEVYTPDGGLVYEGWQKDGLPEEVAFHDGIGWHTSV